MATAQTLNFTDSGGGTPVVFLHGLMGSHRYWGKVEQCLNATWRVIALDLLGFGDSPKPTGSTYSADTHAEAVHSSLAQVKLGTFTLVGHSLGSIVSLRYATMYPGSVSRLILISMPVFKDKQTARSEIKHSNITPKIMMFGPTAWLMCKAMCYMRPVMKAIVPFVTRDVPAEIAHDSLDHNWTSYSRSMQNTIIDQNVIEELAGIQVPTTIVYGSRDTLLKSLDLQQLRRKFPDIQFIELDASHQLPLEKPEEVVRIINEGAKT